MVRSLAALVITCAELLLDPGPKAVRSTSIGPWLMRCEAMPAPCELARAFRLNSGPNEWIKVYVRRFDDTIAMMIETPPLLMPHLDIVLDRTETLSLTTEDCDLERCRFRIAIDPSRVSRLSEGPAPTMILTPESSPTLKVPLELDLLSEGLAQLPSDL